MITCPQIKQSGCSGPTEIERRAQREPALMEKLKSIGGWLFVAGLAFVLISLIVLVVAAASSRGGTATNRSRDRERSNGSQD